MRHSTRRGDHRLIHGDSAKPDKLGHVLPRPLLMAESWEFLLWLVPLAFGGALIYGITGFGSALLTIPVSSHFLPMPFSLAVFGIVDPASQ
jgi:hypothetical protein